jgi:hypothetical protein
LSRDFRRNQIILAITETVNNAEMRKIADQQWQSYLARSYCPGESGVAPSQAKKNVAYIASPEIKIRANKMIQYFLIRSKPPNDPKLSRSDGRLAPARGCVKSRTFF